MDKFIVKFPEFKSQVQQTPFYDAHSLAIVPKKTSNGVLYPKGSELDNPFSKEYVLNLDVNWTFVSLPATVEVSLSTLNNLHVKIIRSFQNGQWYTWTDNNQTSIELGLTQLEENRGYWIKSNEQTTINYIGNSLPIPIDFSDQNNEWKMYGSTQIDDPSAFFLNNPNITILWKYTNGLWQAISRDAASIETLYFINRYEAFWTK